MKLAAFPKCFMDALVRDRTMTVFEWIEMAANLPVDGLEMYDGFFARLDADYLDQVRGAIEAHRLAMPMLCVSPDFTRPTREERREEIERQKRRVDVTARLGGRSCRVLSGQRRPEVPPRGGGAGVTPGGEGGGAAGGWGIGGGEPRPGAPPPRGGQGRVQYGGPGRPTAGGAEQ